MLTATARFVAVTLTAALAGACGSGSASGPDAPDAASLAGTVAAVNRGPVETRLVITNVQPPAAAADAAGRVHLLVGRNTRIVVRRANGTSEPGAAADLAVGARVRAELTEVSVLTNPVQHYAARLEITASP